jgi:hypothetical protein
MSGFSLNVDLGDAHFDEPLNYFLMLNVTGPGNPDGFQKKTDVCPTPTATPIFKERSFSFPVPPEAETDASGWSLQLTALEINRADKTSRTVGEAVLALGGELLDSGEIERRVTFTKSADAPEEEAGQPAGTLEVKLRLTPGAASEIEEVSATGAEPPPAPPVPVQQQHAPPAARRSKLAAPSVGGGGAGPCDCNAKDREIAHQQALVERLMADVEQRTTAVARAGEEVMELRGVNKQLQADLGALRGHVDERERAMEQLASDATNVENIDLPQLQSRHRMLGAAYRADRRRMDQLNGQVKQLTTALGTQEQLSVSYARLKEAHREQGQQMQRLQEEAKKVAKYRQTAKQQETIIQRLESLMAATLKDAKRVKVVEPQLAKLRREYAAAQAELAEQKGAYAKLEEESAKRERQLQQAMEEGRMEAVPGLEKPAGAAADEDDEEERRMMGGGGVAMEEMVKMQMRAEKAERRAAALEEELQEMSRANGREVADLKMKLAEAQAAGRGGFGSAANLALGEIMPLGAPVPMPDMAERPNQLAPLGSSRRSTPPVGGRLDPIP